MPKRTHKEGCNSGRASPLSRGELCPYAMNHTRRGVAAIFDNMLVSSDREERLISQKDRRSLRRTFTRMGFEVEEHCELTLDDIRETLLELKARDHSECDCFLLVYVGHGNEVGILWCKEGVFDMNLLWENFTADQCPSLFEKPKIFIVEACLGHYTHGTVPAADDPEREPVVLVPSYDLPRQADFLVAFSTTPEFQSFASPDLGSWYIQTLCRQLDKYGSGEDLLMLLTRVGREMALTFSHTNQETKRIESQLPFFFSTLIRRLRFTQKTRKIAKKKVRRSVGEEDSGSNVTNEN